MWNKRGLALVTSLLITLTALTGCSITRTKKDEAKLTIANTFTNQESSIDTEALDSGRYDSLMELLLNRWDYSLDEFKSEINQYNDLISTELRDSYINDVDYIEQTTGSDDAIDSGLDEYTNKVEALENTDDVLLKTYESDPVIQDGWDSLSERDRLANKVIGYWVNAVPNDAVLEVLDAYDNNHLILNKDNGTYQIVDYVVNTDGTTEVEIDQPSQEQEQLESNSKSESAGLDTTEVLDDTEDDGLGALTNELYDENRGEPEGVPEYRVVKKNVYHSCIAYTCSYNQNKYKYTMEIENGIVVKVGGKFV